MSDFEDQMIELTIEALTGTVYDLCVSPFETILGIKMKIQRLEGIPVHQQQLVHSSVELQDEYCLEEYGIGSGAQLKLLVAMRGGPIHAHRVQLDDPALLEIAELLDGKELDHTYTVMLLRDGDTVEVTDLVQIFGEDSSERVSPQLGSRSIEQHTTVQAPNEMLQLEHAVTRDKMREVIQKLRKLRSYRRHQSEASVSTRHSGASHNAGMTNVLVVDGSSSTRILRSSAPSPLTPPLRRDSSTPAKAQRKLVFPSKRVSSTYQKEEEDSSPPLLERRSAHGSQVPSPPSSSFPSSSLPPQRRQWRKRRKARHASCLDETQSTEERGVGGLSQHMSKLVLRDSSASKLRGCAVGGTSQPSKDRGADRLSLPQLPAPHKLPQVNHPVKHAPSLHLPPITAEARGGGGGGGRVRGRGQTKGGRSHCLTCGKRTGLASTYTCRCGGVFCSQHRYAESHDCSYDYKSTGREIIARGNPLVMAPKLPKI